MPPRARVTTLRSGWRARLVGGDDAALDLLVDPRVVGGELRDLAVAHEVDAAVPTWPMLPASPSTSTAATVVAMPSYSLFSLVASRTLRFGVADRGLEAVAVVGDVLVQPEGPGDLLVARR